MGQFFIPPESIQGNLASIRGDQAHHILDVMRLKTGDKIQAFDGSGKIYQGKITSCAQRTLKIKIEQVLDQPRTQEFRITLVQALLKKNKMDYVVEKATELGVEAIIPVATQRSIVKLDQKKQLSRKQRWQRIAVEAAKQCGRTTIPEVKEIISWPQVLAGLANFDLRLCFALHQAALPLQDVLDKKDQAKGIVVFIGPEGDFTHQEVEQAQAAGCIAVSLGRLVLKSDTAGICALAMINYRFGSAASRRKSDEEKTS
ncbi:16S rRNA (uracil(1498)-N(3))-methyltransferase [Candidatus Omnitrophota bacterium]